MHGGSVHPSLGGGTHACNLELSVENAKHDCRWFLLQYIDLVVMVRILRIRQAAYPKSIGSGERVAHRLRHDSHRRASA